MMDRYEFKLFGDEEKLYYYLTEGKSDLVVPSLVSNVEKMLYDHNNDDDFVWKVTQTKSMLEREEKEVRKILEYVRRLVKEKVEKTESAVPQNFKFSQ